MHDIRSTMTEVAEATSTKARAPDPDAAWRRGRRRRAAKVGGAAVLSVAVVAAAFTLVRPFGTDQVAPAGGGAAATTVPPSRVVRCQAAGPVACGESQGVAWEIRLTERTTDTVLGRRIKNVRLELWVSNGVNTGWLVTPLPTSGNSTYGRPVAGPDGTRLRPVWGYFTPGAGGREPGPTVSVRVRYGDAKGKPTGAVRTVVVPGPAIDGKVWVAFMPADAWFLGIDGLDAKGRRTVTASADGSCSTPPELPDLACPKDMDHGPLPPPG